MLLILNGCSATVPKMRTLARPAVAGAPPMAVLPLPLTSTGTAAAVLPKVTALTFAWDYPPDTNGLVKFRLYRGTASGTYFDQYDTAGITNRLTISYVRAPGEVDYFVATSVDASDGESLPSNEVQWPVPFAARPWTNVLVSWNAPWAAIEQSGDLRHWLEITNVTGTNVALPIGPAPAFFRARSERETRLTIEPR